MSALPGVSVVIPTHNRADQIGPTLAGALRQTGVELEVIVVDDCSSDGPSAVLERMGDPRLRVLRHEENRGVGAARNTGIAEARREWIAFLDDDDVWAPNKLALQLSRSGDFVSTGAVVVDEQLRPKRMLVAPRAASLASDLRRVNVVGSPSSVLVRRQVVADAGGFDARFSVLADWDLWLTLADRVEASARPEPLIAYVEHDENLHADDPAAVLRELVLLREKHGEPVGDADWWQYFAGVSRRAGRRRVASRAYLQTFRHDRTPSHLIRAAAVLAGERAMALGADAETTPDPAQPDLAWLRAYA